MIFHQFNVLIKVLILGLVLSQVYCLTKSYFAFNQWVENSKMWSQKRLPCDLDTVILPENFAIYLDKPILASKIILPKNGILILDQENWISKKNVNESVCHEGQENKLMIRKNSWFDSQNWNVKYHTFEFKGNDELTNPIPHINRIPCEQDEIRFKSKSTFKLSIDHVNKSYKLKNLYINNKRLVSRDFERYTKSKIGKLQFNIDGPFSFYVENSNDESSDHNVQICQNNFNFFYNKICSKIVNKCPKLNCLNAIRPIGFCCDLCGSLINIEFNDKSIDIESIENLLVNIHLDKYEMVNFFLSKISETRIEIIFIDTNQKNQQSTAFAQELTGFLKKQNFYQLKSIEHQFSEYSNQQNGLYRLLVILIIILIISIILFVYHDNQNLSSRLNSILEYIRNRSIVTTSDSTLTFIRFNSENDVDSLEMEINGSNQRHSKDEFKLRTKNDSISSILSAKSVLFTVDEQNENISFDNPFFKKENNTN